ncbi:hypothetical protein CEUSTIGMA_g3608.t1 [Chlamydomonas eustigma]|uniref:Uncharacterized protein n=1 Tax=Chlamydomonas eustigma TaxID=1157962 RepID=A0A250WZ91_9CHLO|nr:hypothetical protein CEUSTIGMA_g3608.t1 [Chlamydomonas eustigma]|eukprot:GAX76164.1 hypothetical protein CEUSTIGMA_g3608.t1 [Chlamydomonas eustigma]
MADFVVTWTAFINEVSDVLMGDPTCTRAAELCERIWLWITSLSLYKPVLVAAAMNLNMRGEPLDHSEALWQQLMSDIDPSEQQMNDIKAVSAMLSGRQTDVINEMAQVSRQLTQCNMSSHTMALTRDEASL